MNLGEGLSLKHTNGKQFQHLASPIPITKISTPPSVSRPQLSHSNSKQSVTASEDYYSLDENNSSGGNDRDHTPILQQYSTPPSHFRTPDDDQDVQAPVTPAPRPGVSWDEKQLRRKPVGSSSPSSPTSGEQPSAGAEQKSLRAEK